MAQASRQQGCVDPRTERVHAPFRLGRLGALRSAAIARLCVQDPEFLAKVTATFAFADERSAIRTVNIANTFLAGYNLLASGGGPAHVAAEARGRDRYLRPFFYEGAAMGFGPYAMHRRLPPGYFEVFASALSPTTLYQNYVGYGWWLATMRGRFPRRIAAIVSCLDFRYRLLCYEGVGFRDGFMAAGRPRQFTGLPAGESPAKHLWYQGYGRSLWFVYMGDLDSAIRVAVGLPAAYLGDAVSGLGTAIAFSWLDQIDRLHKLHRTVPAALRPEFEQGLSFGWEARQLSDRSLFDQHVGRLDPSSQARVNRMVEDVQLVRDRLLRAAHVPDFYNTWRRLVVQLRRETSPLFTPEASPRPR